MNTALLERARALIIRARVLLADALANLARRVRPQSDLQPGGVIVQGIKVLDPRPTAAMLAALDKAITAGVNIVEVGGVCMTFANTVEMLRERDRLQRELAGN